MPSSIADVSRIFRATLRFSLRIRLLPGFILPPKAGFKASRKQDTTLCSCVDLISLPSGQSEVAFPTNPFQHGADTIPRRRERVKAS